MGDLLYQYENIESVDAGFYAPDHGIQEPVYNQSSLLFILLFLKRYHKNVL